MFKLLIWLSSLPFPVPGKNASEIKMVHQEDAGMNAEVAKLAFSKGIWSYICKMDNALRKYSPQITSQLDAMTQTVKLSWLLSWKLGILDVWTAWFPKTQTKVYRFTVPFFNLSLDKLPHIVLLKKIKILLISHSSVKNN